MPKKSEAKSKKTCVMTVQLKLKPSMTTFLNRAAIEVNQVWNWANATSFQGIIRTRERVFLTAFDLNNLSSGCTKSKDNKYGLRFINADTVQMINQEFVTRRIQFKKVKLKWRKSFGSGRSLGWIPFKSPSISFVNFKADKKKKRKAQSGFRFRGKKVRVFNAERYTEMLSIPTAEQCGGNFAQDSLGNWYINVQICMEPEAYQSYLEKEKGILPVAPNEVLGIDLGIKSTATTSNPDVKLEGSAPYKKNQKKLGKLQRYGHKKQAKFLHRKIKNCRNDEINKFVFAAVRDYQFIKVGDLKPTNLKLKGHAKAGYDHAFAGLKARLLDKGHRAGRSVTEVDEKYTTQACSYSGCRDPDTGAFHLTGPVGMAGLAERTWICPLCGTEHDRDVNSGVCMTHVPVNGVLPVVPRKVTQAMIRAKAMASIG